MFKRRTLQVKVVKDPKVTTSVDPEGPTFEEKVDILNDAIDRTIKRVGVVVVGYVVTDTLRKILVAKSANQ